MQDVHTPVSLAGKYLTLHVLQGPCGSQSLQFLSLQLVHVSKEKHDEQAGPQASQTPLFAK
jgi:hypothetical protein